MYLNTCKNSIGNRKNTVLGSVFPVFSRIHLFLRYAVKYDKIFN